MSVLHTFPKIRFASPFPPPLSEADYKKLQIQDAATTIFGRKLISIPSNFL